MCNQHKHNCYDVAVKSGNERIGTVKFKRLPNVIRKYRRIKINPVVQKSRVVAGVEWFMKRAFVAGASAMFFYIVLLGLGYMFGSENITYEKVYAADEQVVEVLPIEVYTNSVPPVLKRIAKCESGNNQKAKHINPDDVGYYGINRPTWGAKAHELGYNIDTREGNEKMAKYIYAQRGTVDWKYSQKCWNK